MRIASQNYLLCQFYETFMEIIIIGGLEYRTAKFSEPHNDFSFVVALFFTALMMAMLSIHIALLIKIQRLKKNAKEPNDDGHKKLEEYKKKHESRKTLFEEFKDHSFIHQGFLLFFITRGILHGLILILLFEHPIVQIILFNILSIGMLSYLLAVRPFHKTINLIQHVIFEVVILIVNVCLLALAALDHRHEDKWRVVEGLGYTVITILLIAQFLPLLFTVMKMVMMVQEKLKKKSANDTKEAVKSTEDLNFQRVPSIPDSCRKGILVFHKAKGSEREKDTRKGLEDKKNGAALSLEDVIMKEKRETVKTDHGIEEPSPPSSQGKDDIMNTEEPLTNNIKKKPNLSIKLSDIKFGGPPLVNKIHVNNAKIMEKSVEKPNNLQPGSGADSFQSDLNLSCVIPEKNLKLSNVQLLIKK